MLKRASGKAFVSDRTFTHSQMLKKPRSHNIRRHFREDAAFFLPFFRVVVEIIFAAGVISPRTNTVIEIVTYAKKKNRDEEDRWRQKTDES